MNFLEKLHDIVKPAGEKPIIQKLIELAETKTFDYNAAAIECAVCDRLFIVPCPNESHLKESFLENEYGLFNPTEYQVERIELSDVIADKEFLEAEFFRHILEAEEL